MIQNLKFSNNGIQLLCDLEGFKPKAYFDSAGVITIGYGTTYYLKDNKKIPISIHDLIIKSTALKYLIDVVEQEIYPILNLLPRVLKQNEFDAMIIFFYNVGYNVNGFKKKYPNTFQILFENSQATPIEITNAMKTIRNAGGVKGILDNRRNTESNLYLNNTYINFSNIKK